MKKNIITKVGETVLSKKLDNGLEIVFIHKPDFNKVVASVSAKIGSLNNHFIVGNEEHEIVDGIAHFLEHKMFEKSDGDIFNQFSKFGGSANAYTTFNYTNYYFTSSSQFEENFETLLSMMTTPYYTEATVEKEKGIIAEEIKMYEDNSDWICFFETLKNLYSTHPIRIDIGGSVESINKITADDLYLCYNTFYHPSNSIITVVGNFNQDNALSLIDKYYGAIKPAANLENIVTEDYAINKSYSEIEMDVNLNKCAIGFKQGKQITYSYKREMAINIYLEMLFGKTSDNYEKLASKGIYLGYAYHEIENVGFATISADVKDVDEFFTTIEEILENEIDETSFEIYKNKNIGEVIREFNSVDNIARTAIEAHINNYKIEDVIEELESLTFEEIKTFFSDFYNKEFMTKVVVKKICHSK